MTTKQQARRVGPHRGAEHNRRCIERARTKAAEGRVAVFDRDHRQFVVPSASSGETYHIVVEGAPGGVARVRCDCRAGREQPGWGDVACWHGAAACLAMHEAGLVHFDGARWKQGPGPVIASDAEVHARTVSALVD